MTLVFFVVTHVVQLIPDGGLAMLLCDDPMSILENTLPMGERKMVESAWL